MRFRLLVLPGSFCTDGDQANCASPDSQKLEIQYIHRAETKEFLTEYFLDRKIVIEDVNFDVKFMEDYRIYTNIYTINLPWGLSFSDVIEELSVYKNITKLRLVDVS